MNSFSTLFEPNYTILTFLMIKTFFYIEVIGALALIRLFSASGRARLAAFVALLIALISIAAKYVPALTGMSGSDLGVLQSGSGMALPLAVSGVFALSFVLEGRRWWALDAAHLICACGFFGLWAYTLL